MLVFCAAFLAYLKTMCPVVYTMDNGELTVAAYTLSLAHPTGYPLFCLLGKLFTVIMPFGDIVFRISLMNVLFGSLAAVFLFLALSEITRGRFAPFVAALLFSMSPIFWETATSGEVYALNALFMTLNLYLLARWVTARREVADGDGSLGPSHSDRRLYPLAFSLGLALTNHLTSGFLVLGSLVAVALCDRVVFTRWRMLLKLGALFIVPLTLYAYLPLRAHPNSDVIWNNIYQTEGFRAYVTGKMFRGLMFSMPLPLVWNHFLATLRSVTGQFPAWILWALPLGVVALRRRSVPLLGTIGTILVIDIVYASNYAIPDISSYYIPAMIGCAVLLGAGIQLAMETMEKRPVVRAAIAAVLLIAIVPLAAKEFPRSDKSKAYMVADYADNVMRTALPNSFIVACGDSVFNAMLYQRVVHHQRKDLVLMERNIVRTWRNYSKGYSARQYVLKTTAQAPEVQRVFQSTRFTHKEIKDEVMLAAFISAAIKVRPVYLTCIGDDAISHPILDRLKPGYQLIQEGILFRVLPKAVHVDKRRLALYNESLFEAYRLDRIYDGSIVGDEIEREIPVRYATFHTRLGEIETDAGLYKLASANFRKAVKIEPKFTRARDGLAVALMGLGDVSGALKEWRTALAFDPGNKTASYNLAVGEQKARATR